MRLGKEG